MPRSPITRAAVQFARAASGLLRRLGIDPSAFSALLATYLVLDERRGRASGSDDVSNSPLGGGFALTCAMNLAIGFVCSIPMIVRPEFPEVALGAVQFGVFGFAVLVLVADYSAVLLDDTDAALIAPLPVTDRVVFAARIAHITVYTSLVVGSLALPGLIVGSFVYPTAVFVPVYLLSVLLTAGLALGAAFGLFLAALRYLDPDRLKGVVLWSQIGVSVLFMGGLQLLPRMIPRHVFKDGLGEYAWVAWWLPPCHQGGLLALALGDTSARAVGLAALAVGLPLLALGLTVWLASRGFLSGLGRLAVATRGANERRRRSWLGRLLRDRELRAGYEFAAALMRRERQFRLRTYPMIAFAVVIGAVVTVPRMPDQRMTGMLCLAIYLMGLYLPAFVIQARFSESWPARWILEVAPLRRPSMFVNGGIVALAFTLLMPVFLFLLVLVIAVGGFEALPHAVLATEATLVTGGACALAVGRRMPFTDKLTKTGMQGMTGVMMLLGLLVGVAGGCHLALARFPMAMNVTMVALVPILVLLLRRILTADTPIEGWSRSRWASRARGRVRPTPPGAGPPRPSGYNPTP